MEGVDQLIDSMREQMPVEAIGFVIAAVFVIVIFLGLAFFLRRYHTPEPPREASSAQMSDDTVLRKSGDKPLKPAKLLKEKMKTREAAMVAGFIADEVERDLPDLSKSNEDVAAAGVLERVTCGRYYYPEHISGGAEWRLLRRPAQQYPAPLLLTPGWVLQLEKGELSHLAVGAINHLIADTHWQRHPLEIEVARSSINFYWDEIGGKDKVEAFKTLVEKLNQRGP